MVYQWKSLIFNESDSYKTQFPLHYYLLKNDISSVINELKKEGDPLKPNEYGEDALLLTLKFFLKHLNKCLMTSVPLGFSTKKDDFYSLNDFKLSSSNSNNSTSISGSSDSVGSDTVPLDSDKRSEYYQMFKKLSESVSMFFENPRDDELILALQARLLKKTKGFLSVLRVICENPYYRKVAKRYLISYISLIGYPLLYVAIMDYLFHKIPTDLDGTKFKINNVWDCRRLYTYSTKSKLGGLYIMKFITQVGNLLQEFFSLFNDELYNEDSSENYVEWSCDEQKEIILDDLNLNIIEMFAHLAFVTDLPVLFNTMILQPKFYGAKTQFDWNLLLNNIAKKREKFGNYVEPLVRKTLFNKVGRDVENKLSYDIRSESVMSYLYSKNV